MGLLRQLQPFLPCQFLVMVYKAFTKPHLDSGDIIQNQSYNDAFHQRTTLIITT